MEVYFNELCLDDKMGIQYRDIERLKDFYYSLRTKGIKNCRISHTEYAEIIQRANAMPGSNPNVVNFLYAFLCQPYETEGLEERQEEYLLYSWSCGVMSCYGLALAYIMDSMSVSICDQVWNKLWICHMRMRKALMSMLSFGLLRRHYRLVLKDRIQIINL